MAAVETRVCETAGCSSEAKLQCPTCLKLGIQGSYFCSQESFQESWEDEKAKREVSSWTLEGDINTNPWSGYRYTGKLRPHYPLVSNKCRCTPTLVENVHVIFFSIFLFPHLQLAREVLDVAAMMVKAGVTTEEIDHAVHLVRLFYCFSSVFHCFLLSILELVLWVDITVYRNGYHGDLNETFYVGEVDEGAKRLVQTTYECLMQAIDAVKPGVRYRELGNIIQKHAQANGFSVVRSYCGHGIHKLFHTAPNVPHYAKNKAVGVMKPGHVFTIEPMICEGGWQDETWPDGWTAVTRDGKRSAQFEHTLLVTDTGCEILTRRLDSIRPHFMSQ
uniref:Methionine aminopeptidase n=1 Tax=Pavo cristatus TaxID=9049 RepID=A0A8C9L568_PAVCR